jgi:ATP-dependent Clp protease adapter protein ClpS
MSYTKAGSLKINILRGIPVFIHWSLPAGGLLISTFVGFALPDVIYFCIAYTLLIVIHELGHASAARYFGLGIFRLQISGAGGQCVTGTPRTFIAAIAFSTAGILAQALLLIGTLIYLEIIGKPMSIFGTCLSIAFVYVNCAMLVVNLIPRKRPRDNFGTDGYLLWKLTVNRIRGKSYAFPDTSATLSPKKRLAELQGFVPPGFTTGIEILNDNHTTMEFVVSALNTHLRMPQEEAIAAMLDIHAKGGLLISLPTYEKAISVATAITSDAIANGFSLICRPVVVQQN